MNRVILVLLAHILALSACASDIGSAPASVMKVDLDQVVESGVVHSVDGISTAGQPDEKALKVFADNGYAAVIDLRTPGESRGIDEARLVEEMGMDYVSLPVGRDGISFENARSLDELISRYDGPVLVHCGSGNRVGALLALRASLKGADDEAAMAAGREGGLTSLEEQVREVLSKD